LNEFEWIGEKKTSMLKEGSDKNGKYSTQINEEEQRYP
jgi:hypothetical protein